MRLNDEKHIKLLIQWKYLTHFKVREGLILAEVILPCFATRLKLETD